jgi:cephalosporin hydroxylase
LKDKDKPPLSNDKIALFDSPDELCDDATCDDALKPLTIEVSQDKTHSTSDDIIENRGCGVKMGCDAHPAEIHVLNDNEFEIGAIRYYSAMHDYYAVTTDQKVVILKPAKMLQFYRDYFLSKNIRNVLEFGIWQGGSPIALTQLLGLSSFVGIDLKPPLPVLDELFKKYGLDSRISLHYRTSQSDIPAVRAIVEEHFAENSLDLIIDDASHEYEHSVLSFEAAFPYLKPGGYYVIEDWGWSHWPGFENYAQTKAHLKSFSNLVFELTMACATNRAGIESVLVKPAMVIVQKADNAKRINPDSFTLSSVYDVHGRTYCYL